MMANYIRLLAIILILSTSTLPNIDLANGTNKTETSLTLNITDSIGEISKATENDKVVFKGDLTQRDSSTGIGGAVIKIKYYHKSHSSNEQFDKLINTETVITKFDGTFEYIWRVNASIINNDGIVFIYADYDGSSLYKETTSLFGNPKQNSLEINQYTEPRLSMYISKLTYHPGDRIEFNGHCNDCEIIKFELWNEDRVIWIGGEVVNYRSMNTYTADFGVLPETDSSNYQFGNLTIKGEAKSIGEKLNNETIIKFLPSNTIDTVMKLDSEFDLETKEGNSISITGNIKRLDNIQDVSWMEESLEGQIIYLKTNELSNGQILDEAKVVDGSFEFNWLAGCVDSNCKPEIYIELPKNDIFSKSQCCERELNILSVMKPTIKMDSEIRSNSNLELIINAEPNTNVTISLFNSDGDIIRSLTKVSDSNGIAIINGNSLWRSPSTCTKTQPFGQYEVIVSVPSTTTPEKRIETNKTIDFLNEDGIIPTTQIEVLLNQKNASNFYSIELELAVTGNLCSFDRLIINLDNPIQSIDSDLPFQKVIPGLTEESVVNIFQETIEWNNILVGEHNFFIKIIDGKGNTVSEKQIPFSVIENIIQEEVEIIEPEENDQEIIIIEVIEEVVEEEIANEVVNVGNVNRTVVIVDEVEAKEVEVRQLENTESDIALMVMLPISIMIGVSLGIVLIRKKLNS